MKSKIGVNFMVSVGRSDTGDNALAKLLQASQEMVSDQEPRVLKTFWMGLNSLFTFA